MSVPTAGRKRGVDRDVAASHTLALIGIALYLGAVYTALLGIGAAVTNEFPNTVFSAAATTIVAFSFRRARELAYRLANRIVYAERATPYEVLSQFSDRVAGTVAPEDVPARMAWMIARGTGASEAVVWLRVSDSLIPAASWPLGAPARKAVRLADGDVPRFEGWGRATAVRHQGELLGVLTVTRRGGEPLTPGEERLLADLASQAGVVLRNVRLTAELAARVDQVSRHAAELRASRRRIVAAADGERRRLERNIHDGAQQHLLALAVRARLARGVIEREPVRAAAAVTELRRLTEAAVGTLRDIIQGIYPPVLAAKGIGPALRAHVREAGLKAAVDARRLPRYPPAVEAAAYFSCLEALQNASKHAQASWIEVRLAQEGDDLVFEVTDDGVGFDPETTPRGTGLEGMADRLAAAGGSLEIRSVPGVGTTTRGIVPIEGAPR